jgi:hypothetical protein
MSRRAIAGAFEVGMEASRLRSAKDAHANQAGVARFGTLAIGGRDPRSALGRSRPGTHPAVILAPAIRHCLALTRMAGASSGASSRSKLPRQSSTSVHASDPMARACR